MYARLSTKRQKGKTYQYLQLCEAYRNKEGKPRHRILANFGRVDRLDKKKIDSAINALLEFSTSPSINRLTDVEHGRVRDYGDILTLVHLWSRLRLTESITRHLQENRAEFDVAKMIQVMVLNRISDPLSKLGIMRWLPTVYIPELKEDEVEYHHLIRAMDYLISKKKEIERDLYNELMNIFSLVVDLVFYDLTSTYFEGAGPGIAEYGYSRDKRLDRKQIVIALMVTRQGLPIYHEVLPGNTADVSTLKQTVEVLSSKFKIAKTVFVCDRGMISQDNIEKLEQVGFPYIISLRPRDNEEAQSLYQKTLFGFNKETSLKGLLIKEEKRGNLRYIQCHNPEMAKEKKKTREKYYTRIHSEIKKLERRYQKGDLKHKELYHRVLKLLEDHRMAKYFDPKIEDKKVILYIKPQVWDRETALSGKFFIKTNIPEEEISAPEVVQSYKNLQEIENAFREMKDFLKIRPIFHYTEERVKAYVFICVLAYLFEKLVGLYCQRANLPHTARGALSLLSRVKAIECSLNGHTDTVTNNTGEEIKSIFDAMNVPCPGKVIEN